ncbi:MAG: bifunctional glutamine synthetase adenylyltransferase/deadenyltransferase, partial [Gammaproteobacteria bacterium]|nr:bifunctional glutamine synthetase adenylyltransferase/deadenyltransferase [Gammaproteobacteria bacterium]
QALVRARPVAGAPACLAAFDDIRREVLCQAREPAELAREIIEMRERMRDELAPRDPGVFDLKHSVGGITDIEFMVQYAVLRWAHAHPQLVTWTDNLRELESIAELGLWSKDDCATLHDAYFALRAAIHRSILEGREAHAEGAGFAAIREQVSAFWREQLEAAAT